MVSEQRETPAVVPLADVALDTGVPSAAICRYVALALVAPRVSRSGELLFDVPSITTIVVLRVMELADCGPQAMRTHLAARSLNPLTADRALADMASHRQVSHPELPDLLRQLRADLYRP
ncbi:MAG: hypothetical protein DI635_13855 [Pseudoxanthomonas suwonensis]|nr:MAG: hypothetical protein DI635_13855 [Pseudoxanthomonas suwonensis]